MKIVSIARSMPHPGIAHAGGEFFRRHADAVATSHDLVVVCPRTPGNEAALARGDDVRYRRLLVGSAAGTPSRGRLRLRSLWERAVPFLATGPFRRDLLADPRVREELRSADRVELQWFNSVVLAPRLRRHLPGTPVVGVFHDVVSQGHLRRATARHVPLPARSASLLRYVLAVWQERRVLRVLDTAVVLSRKDADLLGRRGTSARVVVVAPPLDTDDMPRQPRSGQPAGADVLFVGAFWRPENEDAALWLLRDIWPRVRDAVPEAHLTIAGTRPRDVLRREADRFGGSVEVTGYVESLGPLYRRASVAVAPVRLGAGVKLKSVVAMLWGVPVVATGVAAEGIDGPDVFLALADDGESFARAVVEALRDPRRALEVAARAHGWAHGTWSGQAYARAVAQVHP